ncbi:MAG: dienelactone hydrolase family protein [Pseudomonadota bacterium]
MNAVAVELRLGGVRLDADLAQEPGAAGLVIFAHGSGSGRASPRNRWVAERLQAAGFATLLFDLLSAAEQREDALTGALRFDIPLLAERLVGAIDWAARQPDLGALRVGLYGASTGAAAALVAAAVRPEAVCAVVSRGGRPDLAAASLAAVVAPTLLIVGGNDPQVIDLNRDAAALLRAPHSLEIIPGATHLFPEPGALERVAELARDWFVAHCPP